MKRADVPAFEDSSTPDRALGHFDALRLGVWVRFDCLIEWRPGTGAFVRSLSATNDDGEIVPIGRSEHSSICAVFLQTFHRWRSHACRSSPASIAR